MYTDKQTQIVETKIKPNIKMIHDMKVRGLKDKYISQALGISVREFLEVKESYELLKDTYNDAMEIFCAELTDIVVARALGVDGRLDKDGTKLPPDEKLAFKLLEKLDSRFSVKAEIKQTLTIESIIKGIAEKKEKMIIDSDESDESEEEDIKGQ